jgi:UDP-N-acetylglucosamine:LPS N-acetylglucosamine transferase
MHFVMYDSAAAHALMPGCEHSMRLGAPPVRNGFGDFNRVDARQRLALPPEDFVVLMTGGAWGIGGIAEGTRGLLGLEPPVHVIAVCGKNTSLHAEMRDMAGSEGNGRLSAFGYVDNMPELMAAANVVVTNGAGQTVLEALCCGRPVVAFAPIAGHGTASAAELVKRDLAVEAEDLPAFVEQIRRLSTDTRLLSRLEQSAEAWAAGREMRGSLAEIEDLYLSRQRRPSYS